MHHASQKCFFYTHSNEKTDFFIKANFQQFLELKHELQLYTLVSTIPRTLPGILWPLGSHSTQWGHVQRCQWDNVPTLLTRSRFQTLFIIVITQRVLNKWRHVNLRFLWPFFPLVNQNSLLITSLYLASQMCQPSFPIACVMFVMNVP